MRPSLFWDRALHLSDWFYTADNIQAFQRTVPHQGAEGHHRRMFACHLQVSVPSFIFDLCICIHSYTVHNTVMHCDTGYKVWGEKLPDRHQVPPPPSLLKCPWPVLSHNLLWNHLSSWGRGGHCSGFTHWGEKPGKPVLSFVPEILL